MSATATDTSSHVLLSTALVQVLDSKGQTHTARLLLDNGSTANFITEDLCHRLNLRTKRVDYIACGISNKTSACNESCLISIRSLDGNHNFNINCYLLNKITNSLPLAYLENKNINIPSGVSLADPTYHIPSSIDILVGADVFWNVIGTNRIQLGKNKPVLFETKLGWVISGSLLNKQ